MPNFKIQDMTISGFGAISPQNISTRTLTISGVSSSSGLQVVYSVTGPALVINNSNVISLTGLGTVTATAFQIGNGTYFPAANSNRTFKVYQFTQTITSFSQIADKTFGDAPFTVTGITDSGLPLSFQATGPVNISGNVVNILGGGVVTITALQVGNLSYLNATPVSQVFTIARKAQNIIVLPVADISADEEIYTLNATSTSGLRVQYRLTSGPVVVAGNQFYPTGEFGLVTITAFALGNSNYLPVEVPIVFGVKQRSLLLVECSTSLGNVVSVTGGTFTGSDLFCVTANTNLPIVYNIAGSITSITGTVYSVSGSQLVTVTAFQPGNETSLPSNILSKEVLVVQVARPTSVYTNNGSNSKIWPNPASDYINVSTERYPIFLTLKNILGKEVVREFYVTGNSQLYVGNLMGGVYILEVYNEGNKETFKLNIAH